MPIDLPPDPGPEPDHVNHLAYVLMALVVMLVFWSVS